MIKKVLEKLDWKYAKICVYAAVTVLVTLCAASVLLKTGPFWSKFWAIFTAVLRPVIIGGGLCYLLQPVVTRLEGMFNRTKEHGWARGVSVLLTLGIIFTVVFFVLGMILVSVYKDLSSVNPESIRELAETIRKDYGDLWKFAAEKLESMNISSDYLTSAAKAAAGAAEKFFSGLLFGLIFCVYFLLDKKHNIIEYWGRVFTLVFGDRQREQFNTFVKDADSAFSGYIRGQLIDAAIVAVLVSVVLGLAGVPYPVIIGVFTGLGNLIPYLGAVSGYLVTVLVCLPAGEFQKMILGLVLIAVVMFVDANVINPKLLSDNVEVHPLLVVAALIAGGAVGGIAGMLIAVPSAALIKMQFDRALQKMEESRSASGQN